MAANANAKRIMVAPLQGYGSSCWVPCFRVTLGLGRDRPHLWPVSMRSAPVDNKGKLSTSERTFLGSPYHGARLGFPLEKTFSMREELRFCARFCHACRARPAGPHGSQDASLRPTQAVASAR